jgi:hypothetical protein
VSRRGPALSKVDESELEQVKAGKLSVENFSKNTEKRLADREEKRIEGWRVQGYREVPFIERQLVPLYFTIDGQAHMQLVDKRNKFEENKQSGFYVACSHVQEKKKQTSSDSRMNFEKALNFECDMPASAYNSRPLARKLKKKGYWK